MMFLLGTTIIAALVVTYFATEGWAVLHTPRREFIFWLSTISCQIGLTILSRDSPIRTIVLTVLGGDPHVRVSPVQLVLFFGIMVPIVAAYVLSRSRMRELQQYNRVRLQRESNALAFKTPLSARMKQVEVSELLNRVIYNSQIRYLVAVFRGSVTARQQKLRNIFQEASPEELNHLLRSVNFPQLFQYGDLAESFVMGRVKSADHLSPLPKAVAMHALMKVNTLPFHRGQREWIRTLFLSTSGDELSVLKVHLDCAGDYHNLYKLVFHDMCDEDLRNEILRHIKTEAEKIQKLNESKNVPPLLKILSDIDDTLYSSGGRWPAGCDKSFPRHSVYPGALAFYEELDVKGMSTTTQRTDAAEDRSSVSLEDAVKVSVELPYSKGGGSFSMRVATSETIEQIQTKISEQVKIPPWNQTLQIQPSASGNVSQATNAKGNNLVFLSARPHAFKDLTESSSYKKFESLFREGRLHTHPTLLAGNMKSGAAAIFGHFFNVARGYVNSAIQLGSTLFLAIDVKLQHPPPLENLRKVCEKYANEDELPYEEEMGANANWESVGRFKAETFAKFQLLYPECDFIFIGDDGQGDVLSAELMSKALRGTAKRPVALMHKVVGNRQDILSSLPTKDLEERDKLWKDMGIRFFSTYVGAATILLDCGLVQPRMVHRVGIVARDELLELIFENPSFEGWPAAVAQLNSDIVAANEVIKRVSGGNPRVLFIEEVKMPF